MSSAEVPRRQGAGSRDREEGFGTPGRFWPSLALPATAVLLLLFVFPFYVVLGVTFGRLDPIFQTPIPVWNPAQWDRTGLVFALSNLFHSDGLYHAAFIHTLVFVVLATALCLLIGYPFAYFVARHSGRFKVAFLVAFFAPFWISYMMRMMAWISLLQDDGYVNRVLESVGILRSPYPWLAGKSLTVVLGLVYGYVPYMILPLYAALDRIPPSLLEASRDLGASPARTFVRVTLPRSGQAILAGSVLVALPMFGDYFTNQLLGGTAGTRMIGNWIVDSLGITIFVARGAALALVLLAFLVLPILYYLRSTRRASQERFA